MAASRRARWVFLGLGGAAASLLAIALISRPKPARAGRPAIPVTVATVTAQDVPVSISALGAAQAWQSDIIVAQVSGLIERVNFTEGSMVRAGQLLAEIDPAPYQAALLQAKGALMRDQAALQGARVDLARYQTLVAQDSIAKQTAEDQLALVKEDEGLVLLDRGQVAAAQVNLDRCHITSPISGRAGVRLVDPGNLVGAGAAPASTNGSGATASPTSGATPGGASGQAGGGGSVTGGTTGASGIVVINQIQPIAVTFTVPQADFAHLSEISDGFRTPLRTQAFTQETGEPLGSGELSIADNKVDPGTGTVQLKARFENADQRLWPGQYVNVTLTLQTLRNAPTVPSSAVNQGPNGTFVYVVSGSHAQMRPVSVETTQAATAVIRTGLKLGETVVTDGQMILKPGALVRVQIPRQASALARAGPAASPARA